MKKIFKVSSIIGLVLASTAVLATGPVYQSNVVIDLNSVVSGNATAITYGDGTQTATATAVNTSTGFVGGSTSLTQDSVSHSLTGIAITDGFTNSNTAGTGTGQAEAFAKQSGFSKVDAYETLNVPSLGYVKLQVTPEALTNGQSYSYSSNSGSDADSLVTHADETATASISVTKVTNKITIPTGYEWGHFVGNTNNQKWMPLPLASAGQNINGDGVWRYTENGVSTYVNELPASTTGPSTTLETFVPAVSASVISNATTTGTGDGNYGSAYTYRGLSDFGGNDAVSSAKFWGIPLTSIVPQ